MKNNLLLLCIFLLTYTSASSQENNINSHVHGIRDVRHEAVKINKEIPSYFIYYNYNIIVTNTHSDIKKNIEGIKKKNKLKNIINEYEDRENGRHVIISSDIVDLKKNIQLKDTAIYTTSICFTYYKQKKNILFQVVGERNPEDEDEFVKAYFSNRLNDRITSIKADSIDFVGRKIYLGNSCSWRSPQNVHCYGKGQISWVEHKSMEEAVEDIDLRIKLNSEYGAVLSDTIIDVNFEFIPSKARRLVYRYGYQTLIAYYVAENIEGRYISCILSNFGANKNDYYLDPLLQQVMDIPQVPDNAYYIFDFPESDTLSKDEIAEVNRVYRAPRAYFITKAGVTLPIGQLSKAFSSGVGGQLEAGWKTKSNFRFGIQFGADGIINRKPFTYYTKNGSFLTKANTLVTIGLNVGYEKRINKNIYCDIFSTIGVRGIITNTKKENSKNKDEYYEVPSFLATMGAGLRYKNVGCFVDYLQTPFGSSKVKNFGNSSIRMGIYVNFDSAF